MPLIKKPGTSPKKRALGLRMTTTRLRAFIWPAGEDQAMAGFCFIADMLEGGVGFYMPEKIEVGAHAQFAFESEDSPAYRGRVLWCTRYVVSQSSGAQKSASYRVGVKIRFNSEAERQRYLDFLEKARTRAAFIPPGIKF